MGLRSRKAGAADGREDAEKQLFERSDAPLQRIHSQTEAFNLLWRDFLFKMTIFLVGLSFYAASEHKGETKHLAFDMVSALFYACSAAWLRNHETTFHNFTADPYFRASALFLMSQVFVFLEELIRRNDYDKELVPTTAFYMILILLVLRYMRGNTTKMKKFREEVTQQD